jgi:hypothetical protein
MGLNNLTEADYQAVSVTSPGFPPDTSRLPPPPNLPKKNEDQKGLLDVCRLVDVSALAQTNLDHYA